MSHFYARLVHVTLAVASFLLPVLPSIVIAQEPVREWSLQPRPLPETKTFMLTEFAAGISPEVIGLQDRVWGPNYLATWDLGLMRNVSPRFALGGSLGITQGNNTEEFSIALKPRLRYWATPRVPIDLSPGIVILDNADEYDPNARFLIDATVSYRDWVGITGRLLTTHIEYPINLPNEPPRTTEFDKTEFYMGLRLGSYPGLIVGSTAAIAWIVLEAIIPDD